MVDPYPTQEEMIQALHNVGIEIRPVMKAMVPTGVLENGIVISVDEMNISDAYRKLVNRGRLNLDPFADK